MVAQGQLDRIAALIDRLRPLASKQRGMPVEAEDWNTLVDAVVGVIGIAREQERGAGTQLEERFASRAHEHLSEVDIGWLDADLKSSLSQTESTVSTRQAISALTTRIEGLAAEVARLTRTSETQQKDIDRSAVDNLERGRLLRSFEDRFGGLENLRTTVTGITQSLDGVQRNLTRVLDLGNSLSDPTGARIDVAKLRRDVADLQALGENLRGVDGSVLRMRDVELRLREVQDAVGVGQANGLDSRIAVATAAAEARSNATLDSRFEALRADVNTRNEASAAALRTQLTAEVASARTAIDNSVTSRLAEAETRSDASIETKLGARTEALRQSLLNEARAAIDTRLATLPNQIGAQVNASTAELATALRAELASGAASNRAAMEQLLATRVAEVETRLSAGLDTRLQNRNEALRTELLAATNRLVADRLAAFGDEVRRDLTASLSVSLRDELTETVLRAVRPQIAELAQNFERRIGAVEANLSGIETRLNNRVTEAVAASEARTGSRLARVETDFNQRIVTRDEVATRNLRLEINRLEGRLGPP